MKSLDWSETITQDIFWYLGLSCKIAIKSVVKELKKMKACVIQPPYSMDTSHSDEYFRFKLQMLDQCDDSIDIIVLPEYSDVPCATATREETIDYHQKYIQTIWTNHNYNFAKIHRSLFIFKNFWNKRIRLSWNIHL